MDWRWMGDSRVMAPETIPPSMRVEQDPLARLPVVGLVVHAHGNVAARLARGDLDIIGFGEATLGENVSRFLIMKG